MKTIFSLDGFLEEGGVRKPFRLTISEARASAVADEFGCLVHAPSLLRTDKEIFGVSAAQARDLAIRFAKSLLKDKRLVDGNGAPVDLSRLK